jgi:hypothetical protein
MDESVSELGGCPVGRTNRKDARVAREGGKRREE